jgi:tRNA C32,U32 (ribose-2'-O)-methylase TrmJ
VITAVLVAAGDHGQDCFASVADLIKHLKGRSLLTGPLCDGQTSLQNSSKVALVFGREVHGLTVEEMASCKALCQISMGRLQESLSLSHAVAIALCTAFESVGPHALNSHT